MKSERCKPGIPHPPHLAFFRWPLRLGRARERTLVAARRTPRLRRMPLVEILQLECPAKPLQFKN
jgi:hypothetical protein